MSKSWLTIVIINYNGRKFLEKCLASLKRQQMNTNIVLVDNGSTDNSLEYVQQNYPSVILLSNSRNLGVARARNQGAQLADGRFFMFLDNDTILNYGFLAKIENYLQSNHPAILGPKLVYPDNRLQYSCRRFPKLINLICRGFGIKIGQGDYLMQNFDHQAVKPVDWMVGACLIVRSDVFKHLDGFDEKYFFGYEDVDFCWRARQKGYQAIYWPQAALIHDYQRKSARNINRFTFYHIKSILRFFRKKWLRKL